MPISEFLKQTPKKHIIFDLDNTLTKLHIDWGGFRDAFWEHVSEFDSQITEEQINAEGRAIHLYNAVILKHGNIGKEIVDSFCEVWEKEKYRGHTANNDLIEFIKKNNDVYTYHMWTSNNRRTILPIIEEMGIRPLISTIVAKEDSLLSKPYPDGFEVIFDDSFDKSDYLMAGDSEHDRVAAKEAGIDFVHIEYRI